MKWFKVLACTLCVALVIPAAGLLRIGSIVWADQDADVQIDEVKLDPEDLHVDYDIVDDQLEVHYDVLTQDFVDFVCNACLEHGTEIDVGLLNIPWTSHDLFGDDLMRGARENPMMFIIEGFYYVSDNRGIVSKLYPEYIYDEATTRRYVSGIKPVADEAMAQLQPGMTDYEKLLVLHDWLIDRVEYGFDANQECFNLYGALVNRVAVCQGYSQAFCFLARMAGLDCGFLSNESMNHAWNVVQLNGKYYNLDVTWDDPSPDNVGYCEHDYLLIDNETMLSLGHGTDDRFDPGLLNNKEFVNAKWAGVDSVISYYNGNWYYAWWNEAGFSSQIKKTSNIYTDAGSVIVEYGSDKGFWTTDDPYGLFQGSYMRAERYNHYLVYNTNSSIEYIDLNNDTYTPVVMYDTSSIPYLNPSAQSWVFEFTVENTQLYYRAYKKITDYNDPGFFEPGSPLYSLPNVLSQVDPEPQPVDPNPNQDVNFADFIERLYIVALNRSSDPSGKEFWLNKVMNEGFTGADCARGFLIESPEFGNRGLSDDMFIRILYRTFFDREADLAGYNFWSSKMQNYMSRQEVIEGFIDATEWCNLCARYGVKSGAKNFKSTIPSNNATKFATRLYTECLGRTPDDDGLLFWALRLTNLESSGYEAARDFFESKEFQNKNVDDETYVKLLYRTFMGRDFDQGGLEFWLGHLSSDMTRLQVLQGFAQSQEFTNICNEYGIDRGTI